MNRIFERVKALLDREFTNPNWITEGAMTEEELKEAVRKLEDSISSKALCKAKTFALIAEYAPIGIDTADIFQDKLCGFGIMIDQRMAWETRIKEEFLQKESADMRLMWKQCGAYLGTRDFGHTSPNTELMLQVGFAGLLERVENYAAREQLNEEQQNFYASCKIVLNAMICVARRLANAIRPYNHENAEALEQIASGAPRNTYEAMQLLILYFFLHDYVGGTRVRTLGRLDVLLDPFYQKDLESGRYTKEMLGEMMKFFLYKFWVAKVPFDLPFCLGGTDAEGKEVTNESSYLIVKTYRDLQIYSPKIHIRVSKKTPASFVKLVLSCIRGGSSSFVLVNDEVGIRALEKVGIERQDARNFVPIGCYEPAVWGAEIGCSDNGGVNLAKAMEAVFTRGKDLASGIACGVDTGKITSYGDFLDALKLQIKHMTECAMDYVVKIEQYYPAINPDPILSCQYDRSVEQGTDVYAGGAKYNNSSMYFYSLATLVDGVCAVKKLVFEDRMLSFSKLGEILKQDWQGYERERLIALNRCAKYGNGEKEADELAVMFANYFASLVNNRPNGRGGVFKAAMYTTDLFFSLGKKTMATPDGRHVGDPLSKNLCATVGMDRHGVTALIRSVTAFDHSLFPTGSVLDVLLHPSAVRGEEGLDTLYALFLTYFQRGGFAMHGNVFDAETLKKAQKDPAQYKTLQVRVCGWNAYFVNLSKIEQDAFIRQAEGNG